MTKIWKLATLAVVLPGLAYAAVEAAGITYEDTATVQGQELKILGAGVRQKWFVNVYALSAYAQERNCDPQAIIKGDEPKMLQITMLRTVGAEKMASTIGQSFNEHMPANAPAELTKQRETFEGYFKEELTKGQNLQFLYVPGTGTYVKQNGKDLGPPLEGKQFQEVLWDIYFAQKSCCGSTRDKILETCKTLK